MVQPAGDGVPLLYITIVMLILSWITFVARAAVRLKIQLFGVDDWLMGAGLILYSVTASLVIVCCFYGAGQKSEKLEPITIMKGTKLFFIAEFFYAACTVPIKCSICATLLRIADARRRWVYSLWTIMVMAAVASVIFIVTIANICHPITALWGETDGICNPSLNSSVSFFFSAISIVTDWSLAILPAVLLWKIQMKGRVKLSVGVMLSLGAFASCATIVRLRFLTLYDDQAEFMFSTGAIGLWSIIEEGIGIVAGSMPALRPLLNWRRRMTNASGSGKQSGGSAFNSELNLAGKRPRQAPSDEVRMDTFRAPSASEREHERHGRNKSHVSDDDGDSQKHILKETQVTVTTDDGGNGDEWARQRVLGWKNRD
ncbi:hypothetical protein F5Y15DRAFT_113403 [Xylariaceae sp. FL0016]|nr:hypothetical protein F5Y15DRAFT_113403 [Xylariaceae sp. FL0016]